MKLMKLLFISQIIDGATMKLMGSPQDNTSEAMTNLMAKVTSALTSDRKLSPGEITQFANLNTMIEQNTIPQLEAGTQKAQGVLDASIKTLHACQTEHQQQKAKAEGLHTNAMDAYAAKLSAEKEMAELVQKIGTMEEALLNYVVENPAPSSSLSGKHSSQDLAKLAREHQAWSSGYLKLYDPLAAAQDLKPKVVEKQAAADQQHEISYCSWKELASAAEEAYNQCWTAAHNQHSAVLQAERSELKTRQNTMQVVKKLSCFLQLLSSNQAANMKTCEQDVNVNALNLREPAVPTKFTTSNLTKFGADVKILCGLAWKEVHASNEKWACGLATTGQAFCVGGSHAPVMKFTTISTDHFQSAACGLDKAGGTTCWGSPRDYWSGWYDMGYIPPPTDLPDFQALRMGQAGKAITCFGHPGKGRGSTVKRWREDIDVLDYDVGQKFLCVINRRKSVQCWDAWANMAVASTPSDLPPLTQVATTKENACALDIEGKLHCWGRFAFGLPSTLRFKYLSAASWWFCAVSTEGVVYAWRDNRDRPPLEKPLGEEPMEKCSQSSYGGIGLDVDGKAHGYGKFQSFWAKPPAEA